MVDHRNILIFTDGTGNSSGKLFKTNVWRLYKAADLFDPEDPRHPRQFAYYHDGVGTSSFKPLAMLGGAFGLGLARTVRDSYAFVCRTYREGDRIHVFGFSRGAFAARLLAAVILNQGIIRYKGDEAELQRNVTDAYRTFRKELYVSRQQPLVPLIRWLRDACVSAWRRIWESSYTPYDKEKNIHKVGGDDLKVEFVGVWDTVAAYGLPVDELTRAVDFFIWPLSMPNHDLSPNVKRAMHAISLDDERNTFHPQLWNEGESVARRDVPKRPLWRDLWDRFLDRRETEGTPCHPKPNSDIPANRIKDERLSQVWFAGVHSDVGGGYPDEGMSYVPLQWIMEGAVQAGVRFCGEIRSQYLALSDENGPTHNSRQGLGGYYRYNPRRIERLADTKRVQVERAKIHESVFRRIKIGQDGYAPIALPPDFDVVRIGGQIEPAKDYFGPGFPFGDESAYAHAREHVFNWVWWRRIAYFVTLFLTLILLSMPLSRPALPKGACESPFCFVSEWVTAIALVLPGIAATWTDSFASHPLDFLVLVVLIGLGLGAGAFCEGRVRDRMRRIWYAIPATKPDNPRQSYPPPSKPGQVNLFIEKVRRTKGYSGTFWFLTQRLMPAGFILIVAYVAFALGTRTVFSVLDSAGGICRPDTAGKDGTFKTDALCKATGIPIEKGGTYRITFTVPASDPWIDGSIPAGPNGVSPNCVSGWMALAVPLRRRLTQPWFKPMARIGNIGTDDYPLAPDPSLPEKWSNSGRSSASSGDYECRTGGQAADLTFSSKIVARSSGDLYVYVNDAIYPSSFYADNLGSAQVCVQLMTDASKQDAGGSKQCIPAMPDRPK